MLESYISALKCKTSKVIKEHSIALVSANIGSYDNLDLINHSVEGVDSFLFVSSDSQIDKSATNWNVIEIDSIYRDPRRTAKIFKVLTHRLLVHYDWIIWLDSNMEPKQGFYENIRHFLVGDDSYFFKHNKRSCVYDEIEECLKWGKDAKKTLIEIKQKYLTENMPKNMGMANCGFFIRPNTPETNQKFEKWWELIENGSVRDQVTFPYVCWKQEFQYHLLEGKVNDNSLISMQEHTKYKMYEGDILSQCKTVLVILVSFAKKVFIKVKF